MLADNISGIYVIRNTVNGRSYVGSSVNLRRRNNTHFLELRRSVHHNPHLQADFDLLGREAFTFEVIEPCPPRDLPQREKHHIDILGVLDPTKGYNIQPEPYKGIIPEEVSRLISQKATGRKLSESTKKKIGDFHRGKVMSNETRIKMSRSQTGKVKSQACREKCRLIHLGVKRTKEQRTRISEGRLNKKSVICFDDDQNISACFENIRAASREMNICRRSIQYVLQGRQQHAGGMCWRYA